MGILAKKGAFKVAGAEKFVAKEHFKVDTSSKAKVKISVFNKEFRSDLLKVTDSGTADVNLKIYKVREQVENPWIIVELGCHYYVFISHLWNAISLQPHGEKGRLLTDGSVNLFFVCNGHGLMWAVNVCWYEGGWGIHAFPVGDGHAWFLPLQVISR